jgi:hypothetical protein
VYFWAVPPPPIVEPIGEFIDPIDPDAGCVVELEGMFDVVPQAVGCAFDGSGPLELELPMPGPESPTLGPESPTLDPESPAVELEPESASAVTMSGWAPLAMSLEAALAEGGGTVRSLWQ